MNPSLADQRLQAALVTQGISTDAVYRLVVRLCDKIQLGHEVLEFGAGSGQLITALLQRGYPGVITGADLQPRPAGLPEEVQWVRADLNHPLPLPNQSFDTIISTEVIEHLENPRFLFREFHRLLCDDGTLILTTPNQECIRSLAGLLGGGHFTQFLGKSYPAHILALLRLDFERICQETGFAPPIFSYTDTGGLPKMPSLTWQSLSFGLLQGRLFSDTIALVTKKLPSQ